MQIQEEQISNHIGECIRMYRKKRGLTITALANRIYKSKATVSKYEKGQIAVDIATLYSIAEVLEISLEELVDFFPPKKETDCTQEQFFYMYNLSTDTPAVLTSVIRIAYSKQITEEACQATLYYNVPSVNHWQDCEHIYRGTADFSEYVTTFHFRNRIWSQEHIHILLSTPLKADKTYQGIILGLCSMTLLPISSKAIVAKRPLTALEGVRESLMFSKEELQLMKKQGSFSWKRNI